jgi:hypothetical protein
VEFRETYRHRVRTSRRFVFENILDLEHVCALHRRWFRNLRVRVRRPDYVEYCLTSVFYGLRQEIVARGAPLDADHYWYEFNGPLASIRVDGSLEGNDGNLQHKEVITFRFRWFLAPLFRLLRPLFRRQKDDILRDDTALLERVYELEQRGFQRRENPAATVVVYGGAGFFGSLLVRDLLANSQARIIVAGRNPDTNLFAGHGGRVAFYQSNLSDYDSVCSTIAGAQVAIDASGPFQGHTLNLLRACIAQRVHYIDLADDRDFVQRAYALENEIEAAGIAALIGSSVVPGIASLLLEHARERLGPLKKARIFITPGTKNPRGSGSFECLLATVGEPFNVPAEDGAKTVYGWSGRERVEFPLPLGERYAYYAVDIADYFVQPRLFGLDAVDFKIASELDGLNRMLGALRWTKQKLHLRSLHWTLPIARVIIAAAAAFGTSHGGFMVEAQSREGKKMSVAVLAAEQGERIPSLLPAIAAERLLSGSLSKRGIVPAPAWMGFDDLVRELAGRGVQVAERIGSDAWTPVTTNESR